MATNKVSVLIVLITILGSTLSPNRVAKAQTSPDYQVVIDVISVEIRDENWVDLNDMNDRPAELHCFISLHPEESTTAYFVFDVVDGVVAGDVVPLPSAGGWIQASQNENVYVLLFCVDRDHEFNAPGASPDTFLEILREEFRGGLREQILSIFFQSGIWSWVFATALDVGDAYIAQNDLIGEALLVLDPGVADESIGTILSSNNNLLFTFQARYQIYDPPSRPEVSYPESPSYPEDGWLGQYWTADDFLSGEPLLTRSTETLDFNWGYGSPGPGLPFDYFAARWTKNVVLQDGLYRFTTYSDDGIRLWIDGRLVVDSWVTSSLHSHETEVLLASGSHSLVVEYFEETGSAIVRLEMEAIGQSDTSSCAAVNTGALNLRTGPSTTFPIVRAYQQETVVEIIDPSADLEAWVRVAVRADGAEGWMSGPYLRPLSSCPMAMSLPTSISVDTVVSAYLTNTRAGWNNHFENELKGRRIRWSGTVIVSAEFIAPSVQISTATRNWSETGVTATLNGIEAGSLELGTTVYFEGTIQSFTRFFGLILTLEDVRLVP